MTNKKTTLPNLLETSPVHQAAIEAGNDHFRSWAFNVTDHLKDKTLEEIKSHLKATSFPFAVCFENWIGDFNLSTGIRCANAFNAKEVFYIGNKKYDRRGAVGAYHYTDVQWLSTIEDFIKLKEKYCIVGIDNIPGAKSLSTFKWQPNTLLVFGEEGVGLTPAMQSMCESIVEIEMFGSIRSLNCGVASGIVMHDFINKYSK